jgi:hypothetical protein
MEITTELIIVIVIEVVIAMLSVLGNGLILYVIIRHNALRTKTNYFIGSLSLADFLLGAIEIPCVIVNFLGLPPDFYGCLAMSCNIIVLTQVSIFNILCIALERFAAVKFPSKYRMKKSSRVVLGVIFICWLFGILVGLIPMFGWNSGARPMEECTFLDVISLEYMVYFNFFVCVAVPMLITCITYGYIFYFIQTQLHTSSPSSQSLKSPRTSRMSKETRAAKLIFVIIVAFAICIIPIHISNTVRLFTGMWNKYVELAFIIMSHVNSAINPLIYALGNRKFRTAMLAFLCGKRRPLGSKEQALASTQEPGDKSRTMGRMSNTPHLANSVNLSNASKSDVYS